MKKTTAHSEKLMWNKLADKIESTVLIARYEEQAETLKWVLKQMRLIEAEAVTENKVQLKLVTHCATCRGVLDADKTIMNPCRCAE